MTSLFFAAFLLLSANGLLSTTLAVRVAEPSLLWWTTPVVAAFSVGLMAGAALTPLALRRIGHIRTFSVLSALLTLSALLMFAVPRPESWVTARLLGGLCAGGAYVVMESWLSALSPQGKRSQTLAYYLILCQLGLAFGQTLVDEASSGSAEVYAAALYVAALVPVAWTATAQPVVPQTQRSSLLTVVKVAPVGVCAAALAGLVTGAWGQAGGVVIERIVNQPAAVGPLMSALYLGGLVLQWPVGWLSDRIDRRIVLQVLGLLIVALHLALVWSLRYTDSLGPLLACLGGVIFVIYPVALAHTLELAKPEETTGFGSTLLLAYGAGSILGPGVLGPLAAIEPLWFLWALTAAGGLLAVVGGARLLYRPHLTIEQSFDFQPIMSPMSAPAQELDTRSEREQLSFPF